jgi:hypothetical protein
VRHDLFRGVPFHCWSEASSLSIQGAAEAENVDLLARREHFRARRRGHRQCLRTPAWQAEFSAIVPGVLWVRLALGASARIAEKCSATLEVSDDI